MRYLRKRKIVLLSIIAIALSCGLLITVSSLFNGFIEALENGASEHLGDVLIAPPEGCRISDYDGLIKCLEQDPAVESATAVLTSKGLLLLSKGDVRAVQVWGIELPKRIETLVFGNLLVEAKKHSSSAGSAQSTQLPAGQGGTEITGYVGIGLVAELDEKTDQYDISQVDGCIGSTVVLTSGALEMPEGKPQDQATGAPKIIRKAFAFRIEDVVFSGIYEFDQEFVYLPIETVAQKLYPGQGRIADTIQINLRPGIDPGQAVDTVRRIWRDWAGSRFAWADYAVIESSRQMQAQLVKEYRKQMGVLMLILGLVSTGIVLLIFCIFYLIVMTKRRDVAIIKSCGLGSLSVSGLYIGFGAVTGSVGAAAGAVLGYIFTTNIGTIEKWISIAFGLKIWRASTYMFSRIPNRLDWEAVLWVSVAAVLAAVVGSLIPAISAARVEPVRILRYE